MYSSPSWIWTAPSLPPSPPKASSERDCSPVSRTALALAPSRTTPRTTRGGMFPAGAVLQPPRPFSKSATSFVFASGSAVGGAGVAGGGAETSTGSAGVSGAAGAGAGGGGETGPVTPAGRAAEIPIEGVETSLLDDRDRLARHDRDADRGRHGLCDGHLMPGPDRNGVADGGADIRERGSGQGRRCRRPRAGG